MSIPAASPGPLSFQKYENTTQQESGPRRYEDIQVEAIRFMEVKKNKNVYVVPFERPLVIQTPVSNLLGRVDKATTSLALTKGFASFVRDLEEYVVQSAIDNKDEWFRSKLDDDAIRQSFKSFLGPRDVLKVRVSDDVASFDSTGHQIDNDEVDKDSRVRCLLELTGICFGRVEFGIMFTVVQIQTRQKPVCEIKQT